MNFLRLLPVLISFLLVAAHFYRAGQVLIAGPLLLLPLLLLVRKDWVPLLMQIVLVLAAIEWVRTLTIIAQTRIQMGEPWTRMAVILGVVALFTALSGLVFRSAGLRKRFSRVPGQ